MINNKYCGNCFRAIIANEKVAYGVGNSMVCCMDCFYAMAEVPYDND